jgi:adenylate kinase family enzyme
MAATSGRLPTPATVAGARRIAVTGPMGAGKTVLAGRLSRAMALPRVSMDALFWGPGWQPAPPDVFLRTLDESLAATSWVADGVYRGVAGDLLWSRADAIVWLDLPLPLCVARTLRRTVDNARQHRPLWNGNRDSWRRLLSRESTVAIAVRDYRPAQRDIARRWWAEPDRVVRLHDRCAVGAWLAQICGSPAGPRVG